jgi:monothiol glutaredoxin
MEDLKKQMHDLVTTHPVVLFMKGTKNFPTCGFSGRATQILKACGVGFVDVNVLADPEIVPALRDFANWPTIPVLYIGGEFIGGCDIMTEMYQNGELQQKLAGLTQTA